MAEIKKHIESRLKELAKERMMYLVQKVQPGGFKSRATVPSDCHVFPDDWKTYEESCLDISELCNWCRLYFGESMRPPMTLPPIKLAEAEKTLVSGNALGHPDTLDESVDDKFKELVQKHQHIGNGVYLPRLPGDDDINCEWITWAQLTTKPQNQRLQGVGLIEAHVADVACFQDREGGTKSLNPMDYDYLIQREPQKDDKVIRLREVQSRKVDTKTMPWRDLDVEQAVAARSLVTRALKINPTIRDLAMHNYVVENGKVIGLDLTTGGTTESIR